MKLSQAEYLAKKGFACPYCGSGNILALSELETEEDVAKAEVKCLECGGYWRDVFKLNGYEV